MWEKKLEQRSWIKRHKWLSEMYKIRGMLQGQDDIMSQKPTVHILPQKARKSMYSTCISQIMLNPKCEKQEKKLVSVDVFYQTFENL